MNPELIGPLKNAVGRYGRGITDIYTQPLLGVYEIKAPTKSTTTANKTTIACVKGTLIKKVIAVKPKCPAGYNVKK